MAARQSSIFCLAVPPFIFISSCLPYLISLGHAPASDELHQFLAARGLLEHGEPRIAEGLYARIIAYIWLIAQLFGWFGKSMIVARLPCSAWQPQHASHGGLALAAVC